MRPLLPAVFSALFCLCGGIAPAADPPVRGRDPWAFRLAMENKPRMLVVALRPDLWAAYNPANGTLHKVWSGGMTFRGKVYDFGQRNSVTQGTTYHLLEKAFLLSATSESSLPAGWSATGVAPGGTAWILTGGNAVLASPAVDLTHYDRVVLAYQTPGGINRLLVDVSTDNGATWTAQQWMSMDAPGDDGHQKLLAVNGSAVRVRFRRNVTNDVATLADVTLFGDYRAWSLVRDGQTISPVVDWRGYRLIGQTAGIVIRYDLVLPDGGRIAVEESPEALPGAKLARKFSVQGLPAGSRLALELDGTGYRANHNVTAGASGAALRSEGGDTFLDFTTNVEATLETLWTP
ncbi:MAG: Cytochrome c class [Akkermansiaceae bacterium]|nr:Cytochrome c class [Akkermansiaceae bacterium]